MPVKHLVRKSLQCLRVGLNYLDAMLYEGNPLCDPSHYYLLNSYHPGYFGTAQTHTDDNERDTPFTTTATIHKIALNNKGQKPSYATSGEIL